MSPKGKTLKVFKLLFFVVGYWKVLLGYMKLKERGFQRPSKLAFPLCYAICG